MYTKRRRVRAASPLRANLPPNQSLVAPESRRRASVRFGASGLLRGNIEDRIVVNLAVLDLI